MMHLLTKIFFSLAVMAALLLSQGFYQKSPAQGAQQGGVQVSETQLDRARQIMSRLTTGTSLRGERSIVLKLVEDESLNAATNGQEIQFTTGLWNALRTDDQRAFVIAHELAHIELGHIPQTVMRRTGLQIVDQLVLDRLVNIPDSTLKGQIWGVARQAGMTLVDLRFSRSAEYEADQRGLQILASAGYDPAAAIQTLEILQAASPSGVPQFLRSHPMNENRIRALVAEMEQQQVRGTVRNYPSNQQPGLFRRLFRR